MSHNSPRVVHITPRVQAHGGTETLHNYHRHLPGEQVFVALFDRAPERRLNYINLGFTWRTPLREMRRRFALALAPLAGRLVIYHDGWGLPLFHDLDQSSRRVVMLHSDPAYHAAALPGLAGLIDGALAITPAVQRTVAIALPELVEDRTHHCQVPIELPTERIAKKAGGPLIFGYVGRLERAQKRLDRLPKFIRAMRATGTDFRFELIGDGAYRRTLERELAGQAHLYGWVTRTKYKQVMANWDAVVFLVITRVALSDYSKEWPQEQCHSILPKAAAGPMSMYHRSIHGAIIHRLICRLWPRQFTQFFSVLSNSLTTCESAAANWC